MRPYSILLLCVGCLLAVPAARAQTWGEVTGTVSDAKDETPIPSVTVIVEGTNYGTATNEAGRYSLRLPTGRHTLRFSFVGFKPHTETVEVEEDDPTRLDVVLEESVTEMEEVRVVDSEAPLEAGVYEMEPEEVQDMPAPFKDPLRALKTVPGVASNNELSQQISVRGGGFNENLIFVNGFEVFLPFRARRGEQEGLGLLNPALATNITFYTGGFPARYGGKLSSALDVEYAQPDDQSFTGSADISTFDANVHAQSSALGGDLGWAVGVRRAQPGRFFGTQDVKGDYNPSFTDVQGMLTYRVNDRVSMEALGIKVDNTFELEPEERTTFFGIISPDPTRGGTDLKALRSDINGARDDGYGTTVVGTRLKTDLSDQFQARHSLGYFSTRETESFDVTRQQRVCQVDPTGGANAANCFLLGESERRSVADNRVDVERLTGRGRYEYTLDRHNFEGGWHIRSLHFDDQLNEKTIIKGRDEEGPVRIRVDSLRDGAVFDEQQFGFYAQDAVDVLSERDRLVVTGGLRTDYYTFNDEWTVSPRLSARYVYNDQLTLTGSWGIYHQQPTYRELRGTPEEQQSISEAINREIESQRSMQAVLGGEYFFPDRRLYLRAEGYYKDLSNIITYTIDNVRVDYSGHNDAEGFTYGLDVQLRGEFVPGLESRFNYSYMVARERFTDEALDRVEQEAPKGFGERLRENREGLLPRPADQRHTFSAFVQDYVPGDETWRLHMRLLYGSGLPHTSTDPGPEVEGVQLRVPARRMGQRLPAYRRVDVGATKEIELFTEESGTPVDLDLTLEVLNLFDMENTVDYTFTQDFTRVPKRLTPRTVNVRAHFTF